MRIRRPVQMVITLLMLSACANSGQVESKQGGPTDPQARLEAAISDQDYEGVRSALVGGARADRPLPSRKHPLNWAVHLENLSIARLLLRSGADPNQLDGLAESPPLAVAIHAHSRTLVDELIRAGADPNKRFGDGLCCTSLGLAALAVGGGAISPLVDGGADVNAWNLVPESDYPNGYRSGRAEGRTALMLAAEYGNDLNVILLLGRGADPSLRNEHGKAALDLMGDPTAKMRNALTHPEQYAGLKKR